MNKKLTATLLALTMAGSLCGCGNFEQNVKQFISDTYSSLEDAGVLPNSSESSEGKKAKNSAKAGTEEALEEVQQIMRQFNEAMKKNDSKALIDLINVEMLYYMEYGKTGTSSEYRNYFDSKVMSEQESQLGVLNDCYDLFETQTPVYSLEKELEYNEALVKMDELSHGESQLSSNFYIDGVYLYRIEASTDGSVEAGDAAGSGLQFDLDETGGSVGMDIAVVRINGEWKIDFVLPTMQSILNMFGDIMQ